MTETFIGHKQVTVNDEIKGISFPVLIQYPTHEKAKPVSFGPYVIDVSVNAEVIESNYPLAIISHGTGSSPLVYRTFSSFLARNGYVVATIEHYKNNRTNNELEGKNENFANRLRHISQTIDYLFTDNQFAKQLHKDRVVVIGHSIGANTAFVLAGGVPISFDDYKKQFGITVHMGEETKGINFLIDNRIKALVLFALLPGWFTGQNSLEKISIPVLIFNAEKDDYIPAAQTNRFLEVVKDNSLIKCHIVQNAGHFSFLSPFPDAIKDKVGLAAKDPDGFDREKFHEQLQADILDFLNNKLNKEDKPLIMC